MFNSDASRRVAQDSSCDSSQSRAARGGLGKTDISSMSIGVEDIDESLRGRNHVVCGGVGGEAGEGGPSAMSAKSGKKTSKGWEYWSYRALLLGVAAIWGTNFPVVKFVESHAGVSDATAAFVRFAIAAGAMLPFADWAEKEVLFAGMEIGAWVSFGYFTQAIGLQTSDASVCAFLCSLTVVFVPLFDTLAGKGIKFITIVASLLALVGTGFLELGDAHASWNDLWCVAQAAGFGMAFTRIELFPGKSLQLSIGQLISVAGLTGVWCTFAAGGQAPDFSFMHDPSIAAALVYTGLVTTSLAIWLETIALEQVPAAEMSVIFSTEPLWATFVSGVFLKETMGPNALIGAAFIFMACLAAQSEQILAMVGKGGGKDTDSSQMMQLEGEAELSHAGSGEDRTEDAFPLSMLDEMEPGAESELELSFDMSLLKEFNVPDGGMHMGGSALEGREAANRSTTKQEGSAVRIGWLASADVSRLE
eukprot:jgi/Undpi1/1640/HiC_scaffold_11.g05030.m1